MVRRAGADLRLNLATAGLPKGSVSGYELMDSARFGQTQFQERLTAQRGLEGELTRSITSMAAVQNARVHLALPNQNGFFREQQKPSASVLLSLHPGRTLDRAQVAGIVHLVSSSVPELDPKAVSVLDQSGALLTGSADALRPGGLDAGQLQYLNQIETGYAKRIFELLEPIVGHDNLRATVAADVDFTQSEATSEEFKPNQGAEASISIRSQQTTEQSGSSGAMPSGVPGAASNQPPVAATAPLVGASQPLQPRRCRGGANGRASGHHYESTDGPGDRMRRHRKTLERGGRRQQQSFTDAKGKTTQVALNEAELEKLTSLVRESIGYKQDRGDSVKVINAPFRIETIPNGPEVPWWKAPDNLDLLRSFAMPGALVLVALLVFFGLVRPGLKAVTAPPVLLPGSQLNAVADDATSLPMQAALAAPRMVGQLESASSWHARTLRRRRHLRGWVGRTSRPRAEGRRWTKPASRIPRSC